MSKIAKAKCAGCNKDIRKNYVKALGKKWHLEHFKCAKCSKILSRQTFFVKNGEPYCQNDFLKLFKQICRKCNHYITSEAVKAYDNFWHVSCFTCTTCQKPIKPPHFFFKDGKPYCVEDYEKNFLPICKGCGECIFEDQLKVIGGIWHCKCFCCQDCSNPIENKYFLIDMKPVCITCAAIHKKKSKRCYQSCCSLNAIQQN